jgi:hypothetical protein
LRCMSFGPQARPRGVSIQEMARAPRETPLLRTGLGRLLASWVIEVIVFGVLLARHLASRAATLATDRAHDMVCTPHTGV